MLFIVNPNLRKQIKNQNSLDFEIQTAPQSRVCGRRMGSRYAVSQSRERPADLSYVQAASAQLPEDGMNEQTQENEVWSQDETETVVNLCALNFTWLNNWAHHCRHFPVLGFHHHTVLAIPRRHNTGGAPRVCGLASCGQKHTGCPHQTSSSAGQCWRAGSWGKFYSPPRSRQHLGWDDDFIWGPSSRVFFRCDLSGQSSLLSPRLFSGTKA